MPAVTATSERRPQAGGARAEQSFVTGDRRGRPFRILSSSMASLRQR